jgi:sugar lactone lactonase YvrE
MTLPRVGSLPVEIAIDAHALLGEGPAWDARRRLLAWVDIDRHTVHLSPTSGGDAAELQLGEPVSAVIPRASGGYVVTLRHGIAVLGEDGSDLRRVAEMEAGLENTRMNDAKCDRNGRLWAGSMAIDGLPDAALYRMTELGPAEPMIEDVVISNGIGWSLDERRMYYIDSPTGWVDVLDYDPATGSIANRRHLIDIPPDAGQPDGMTVDAEGHLWVALWGGSAVHRYTEDGRLDRRLELPVSQVTSCCFGGADLDELYVTSAARDLSDEQLAREPHAGAVFVARPGVEGLPTNEFAA